MPDDCPDTGKKRIGPFDAFNCVNARRRFRVVVFGKSVDLFDVKDRVSLEERNGAFSFLASRGAALGADDLVGVPHWISNSNLTDGYYLTPNERRSFVRHGSGRSDCLQYL